MIKVMKRLLPDRRGTSSVELAFICATIILAMMAALSGFADASTEMWTDVKDKSEAAIQDAL
jgi:Flp pilus assembly pilin Flp